ncbi:carbamate kinase [Bacillus glycinifermentans]|uniref:Carbamate kinase n=1 Tax=Bacillus glycinifermentans TaxID=1664069 RepID=A0A0J6ECE4_9BACI|nr:carbamate kinase [Bacillus glycinifermentans]ATH93766.1 carbamate kinase [Bacillus glycinifermentans]KMM59527.1 carbamate kinase [Bacillus glycinifermentans]KRT90057.1 carbamate kinase [Bacillus glycinifermentans]MEC0483739.1 carbamate kinase [Bacillus glycinifermentans]MEC0496234.1 carbamate kinase [Bacillus glycinifermentans]
MKKRKIVVALGGNAIQAGDASAEAQQQALKETAAYLADMLDSGTDIIITHGNGPQVGSLMIQQKAADSPKTPAMPLETCVSMTQGMIGYWLQNAIDEALHAKGKDKHAATVITRVAVSGDDEAFRNPTKPIGPFYSEQEAKELMNSGNGDIVFKEDAGRGWRRVVPSPVPVSILEYDVINDLVEKGHIVIAAGGGGIPVIEDNRSVSGIDAVIDKDFAACKLAELVQATELIILTAVDYVAIDYLKPTERTLKRVTTDELKGYIEEKQFAEGSMLPKVKAAIQFAEAAKGNKAVITSLQMAKEALEGRAGTIVEQG